MRGTLYRESKNFYRLLGVLLLLLGVEILYMRSLHYESCFYIRVLIKNTVS